jgi:hypothetical protein
VIGPLGKEALEFISAPLGCHPVSSLRKPSTKRPALAFQPAPKRRRFAEGATRRW